jgi:signal peptidase I
LRFVPDFLLVYLYCLAALRAYLYRRNHESGSFLDSPIALGIAAILLIHFVARLVYVPSRSMLDTLHVRDALVVDCTHYRLASPQRGEIAVFYEPAPSWRKSKLLVKRIIALDGDKIGIHGGRLFINDAIQPEPYVRKSVKREINQDDLLEGRREKAEGSLEGSDFADHWVAPHCFFALGDNRNNSMDSRSYGDVPQASLVGLIRARIWPLSRIAIF